MRKKNRVAHVAYEAPRRGRHNPLRWHRRKKGGGVWAQDRSGVDYDVIPSKEKSSWWDLLIDGKFVNHFDSQGAAKDFADANWRNRFREAGEASAPSSGSFRSWRDEGTARYAREVVSSLEKMGMNHSDAHRLVTDSARYVDAQSNAGTAPHITAAILDATKHHGHQGTCGQHTNIFEGAGEAGAPGAVEMWRVTVTDLQNGERESRVFSDYEKAQRFADLKSFSNTIVRMGPERGGHRQLSLENSRVSHEANDSTCQPFTRLTRDQEKLSACMLRAKGRELRNSRAIYDLVRADLERRDQETFAVVCLGMRGELRDFVEIARGQRHRVAVDVEDILRPVLASGCDYFVVMHNHPSGVAEPSDADCELTETIRRASSTACPNVVFADHIVVGAGQFYSFADQPPKKHGKEWQIGKVTKIS